MKTRRSFTIACFVIEMLFLSVTTMAQQQFSQYWSTIGWTTKYFSWRRNFDSTACTSITQYTKSNYSRQSGEWNCGWVNGIDSRVGQTAIGEQTCANFGDFRFANRAAYQWNFSGLNAPDVKINSVRLEVWYTASVAAGGITVKSKKLTNTEFNMNAENRWNAIKNSTTTYKEFTVISSPSGGITPVYYYHDFPAGNAIYSDIENAIETGSLFSLGLMVDNDEYWPDISHFGPGGFTVENYGNVCEAVKLTVSYSRARNITVQNPFSGGGIIVDDQSPAKTSPFIPSPKWYEGETHKLTSYSQTAGSQYYTTMNSWTNITTNTPINQNPAYVTITNDATYQANFAVNVTVDQKWNDGTSTSVGAPYTAGVDLWEGGFVNYSVPRTFTFPLSTTQILRGTQELLYNANFEGTDKYNTWYYNNSLESDVKNHHSFLIQPNTATLVSQLQTPAPSASININVLESPGSYSGTVQFKDPWLVDYNDGYGMRNQGMSAPLKNRNAPFSADYSTSYGGDVYKGVFTGQTVQSGTYYSVGALQTQNFTLGGQSRVSYFQNWSTNYAATVQSAGSTTTPVVFTGWGSSVTANYKAAHVSNDPFAFVNNSQRRFVQTKVGTVNWLHQVYASAGQIWLEHSSDGGSTWILGNYGKSLGSGKNPSIAYTKFDFGGGGITNYIGVVWQQQSGSTYTIQGMVFNQNQDHLVPYSYTATGATLFNEPSDAYTTNANPNIMLSNHFPAYYFVTFERKSTSGSYQPGINWLIGSAEDGGGQGIGPFSYGNIQGKVAGTDASSTNAQLSFDPCVGCGIPEYFGGDLVYSVLSPGQIYHTYLYLYIGNWNVYKDPTTNISYPYGNVNSNPSIITLPNGYHYAACWIEYIDLAFYSSVTPGVRYYYGSGVQSCSINRGGNTNNGFVVWSQLNGGVWSNKSLRFNNGLPAGSIQTLSTSGRYVQAGNGAGSDHSNMYVSSFSLLTTPYSFSTSGTLGPLSKAGSELVEGRGFSIEKGEAAFNYRFGDLNVDGVNIGFVETPDSLNYNKTEILNNALVTEPFQLKSDSRVVFTERSGFADSAAARESLGADKFIRYKVELIDDATGKVVGTIRNVSLTSANTYSYKTPSYSLNANQLAGKTVRAKITMATNLSPDESQQASPANGNGRRAIPRPDILLIKSFTEENQALAKSSLNELAIDGIELPTTYALEQNYPNPFNPTTTISYALPTDGVVTVKVYDALGREVKTLVSEFKTVGRYNVEFDASSLASGLYIYKIVVQPLEGGRKEVFTAVKKMLMLK